MERFGLLKPDEVIAPKEGKVFSREELLSLLPACDAVVTGGAMDRELLSGLPVRKADRLLRRGVRFHRSQSRDGAGHPGGQYSGQRNGGDGAADARADACAASARLRNRPYDP